MWWQATYDPAIAIANRRRHQQYQDQLRRRPIEFGTDGRAQTTEMVVAIRTDVRTKGKNHLQLHRTQKQQLRRIRTWMSRILILKRWQRSLAALRLNPMNLANLTGGNYWANRSIADPPLRASFSKRASKHHSGVPVCQAVAPSRSRQ